jgi:hypothetical protein
MLKVEDECKGKKIKSSLLNKMLERCKRKEDKSSLNARK